MTNTLAATPRLDRDGTVAVLYLGSGENRFNPDVVGEIQALLDEVEGGDYTALVTTAVGKIWSNGFDLPWVGGRPEMAAPLLESGQDLFARVLTFPMPTVAALQGHAFAAGMILALAHDLRVMRADRGYLCLPEVTFAGVFTPGNTDLLKARMTPQVAHRAMVLGDRFNAPDALASALIDEALPEDELLSRAVALAGSHGGHDRAGVTALKRSVYTGALSTLSEPTPPEFVELLTTVSSR